MRRMDSWSDDEIAILREVWADDSLRAPQLVAAQRLPMRTSGACQVKASVLGLGRERMDRQGVSSYGGRRAAPKSLPAPPEASAAPRAAASPPRVTLSPVHRPVRLRNATTAPRQRVPDFLRTEFDRWSADRR